MPVHHWAEARLLVILHNYLASWRLACFLLAEPIVWFVQNFAWLAASIEFKHLLLSVWTLQVGLEGGLPARSSILLYWALWEHCLGLWFYHIVHSDLRCWLLICQVILVDIFANWESGLIIIIRQVIVLTRGKPFTIDWQLSQRSDISWLWVVTNTAAMLANHKVVEFLLAWFMILFRAGLQTLLLPHLLALLDGHATLGPNRWHTVIQVTEVRLRPA